MSKIKQKVIQYASSGQTLPKEYIENKFYKNR